MHPPYTFCSLVVLSSTTAFGLTAPAWSQITPDATLGDESSVVVPGQVQGNPADLIEGGAQRGSNLFHSFVEFNIDEGQQVYFANPEGVESILSRVTGGNPSNIFGTLGVDGSADLVLLNPNGVVFGEAASLDISGSFYVTTGEAIPLGTGVFSAVEPQSSSLLTVAPEVSFFNYLTVDSGDITSTAQLIAGEDLALAGQTVNVRGQLTAGEDLSLLARETVTVQDTPAEAFVAQAGNDLTIQGNQGVDILALNHLEQTPFVSGGDLTLVSGGMISADAHFEVGGDFATRTLTGELADLGSLEDPIFTVGGDFAVGDYTGASLQVTAGNDITYGTVVINAIDPAVDPTNPALLLDAGGSITGTGNASTTVPTGELRVQFSSGEAIRIADIATQGGPIMLTSEEGGITSGVLDATNGSNAGGNITLDAGGNISTGDILSFAEAENDGENAADGGSISISSSAGDVFTGNLGTSSLADDGDTGNGGAITLAAAGRVTVAGEDSNVNAVSRSDEGDAGNGGTVSISAASGDIAIGRSVNTVSRSDEGNSQSGGTISITADFGNINIGRSVNSASLSEEGDAGNAGGISLSAVSGDVLVGRSVNSFSRSDQVGDAGNGGDISIAAAGDIAIARNVSSDSFSEDGNAGNAGGISLSAAGNVAVDRDVNSSSESEAEGGDAGDGGSITIAVTSGDIAIGRNIQSISFADSESEAGGDAGNGGAISIASVLGNVAIDGRVRSRARSRAEAGGEAGNGGLVDISADSGTITIGGDIESSSSSNSGNVSDGAAITLTASGDITVGSESDAGDIVNAEIDSRSVARTGDSGNGGAITITSTSGSVTIGEKVESRSGTSSDQPGIARDGGAITISAAEDVIVNGDQNDGDALNSGSRSRFEDTGNGGAITLTSNSGAIKIGGRIDSLSYSANSNAGDGADIAIAAVGDVTIDGGLQSFSFSNDGDAGNGGAIDIFSTSGDITVDAVLDVFSFSETRGAGNGGLVSLRAPLGTLQGDNARINSFAAGGLGADTGSGGDITLEAEAVSNIRIVTLSSAGDSGDVRISNTGQTLEVDNLDLITSGQTIELAIAFVPTGIFPVNLDDFSSQSGETVIESDSNINLNNVSIQADANGSQPAGSITITSPGQITFNKSQIDSNANSSGDAGEITLNAASVRLGEGDRIFAATSSDGDGGTITINATESVFLGEGVQDNAPIISVEASGAGQPGDISINTPNFVLSETARITATATATATNIEDAGSITLNANQMNLAGTVGIFAETQGQAPGGQLVLQPYQTNPDLNVSLADNAVVSASTTGSGTGGGLEISAPDSVTISGPGQLVVTTDGSGPAGDIDVTAQQLTLADGVTLSAATTDSGVAGDITFNVSDSLIIDGSTVESSTEAGSTGLGGNINFTLDTTDITIQNGGRIKVDSDGEGMGGNVELIANTLTMNDGEISAATVSTEEGGNLNFDVNGGILLQGGSLINAESTNPSGGSGGNITLGAGFVFAVPDDNNDIIANAVGGDGGSIIIESPGIFGLTEQSGFTTQELRDKTSSDISASSQFGQQGTIAFIGEVDLTSGLNDLPEDFVNADELVASSCIARGDDTEGSFVVTGNGGLAQQPGNDATSRYPTGTVRTVSEVTATNQMLQEPEGIYQLADGRLVLSHECRRDDVEF